MKIPEIITERPTAAAEDAHTQPGPIAPWWHTALIVVVILGVSILSGLESKTTGFGGQHIKRYLIGIVCELVLVAAVWWGIRLRNVPLRQLLGERRRGAKAWAKDFGIALIFWVMAMLVLAALATVLRLLHLMSLQKAVMDLAPRGGLELIMWIALSITAGIAEEIVFRGYLLQQFASIDGRRGQRAWFGVIASSLVFGAGHGYEGIGGAIAITVYGVMFCVLALQRGSLRTGMMAHAWHDSITGIVLAIAKHVRAI
jgi:membrane protease YdiL (CAAX protease family)